MSKQIGRKRSNHDVLSMRMNRLLNGRSEWEQLIHAYHLSGLSSKQFCLANNLGYASFCQWRRRLSSESESPDAGLASSFIDMGSLSPMNPSSVDSSPSWQIVLKLGNGVELCLNPHVPS